MNADASALDPALPASEVGSFAIDSREVAEGGLFFALSQPEYRENGFNGDFDDSTKYVRSAIERGAVACVVRPDRYREFGETLEPYLSKLLFADDVIAAFQRLAHGVYLEWNKPVVAITGSAGKTTAKELTAHVLAASGKKVLRNIKNYNNGLGHPLTVLNLASDKSYDVAVLEMGMSTPLNEIERLCRITPPDVAVELNVLPVHLEHLGSIERIAEAKGELVEGLKAGGIAVLNADDFRVAAMSVFCQGAVITYGIENPADVQAENINFEGFGQTTFDLSISGESGSVSFPLNGKHNVMNALAASAVGFAFGMSVTEIAAALTSVEAPPQRGEVLHFAAGFTVINDSYNSNPDALISMVDTLIAGSPNAGRRIVVAGEMLELGPDAVGIHTKTGTELAARDIDVLIGVRGLAEHLTEAARRNFSGDEITHFAEDAGAAGDLLVDLIQPGDAVLVKGSRGVRTETVIEKLLAKFDIKEEKEAVGA